VDEQATEDKIHLIRVNAHFFGNERPQVIIKFQEIEDLLNGFLPSGFNLPYERNQSFIPALQFVFLDKSQKNAVSDDVRSCAPSGRRRPS
jgi:hypothetical protein